MNPFTPGTRNFYYYEYMKAQDELKEYDKLGIQAPSQVIANVKSYKQLWKESRL